MSIESTIQIITPRIREDFNINDFTEEVAEKVFKRIISSRPKFHDTMGWLKK